MAASAAAAMERLQIGGATHSYEQEPLFSGGHNGGIWRVLALSTRHFAGASYDHGVKMWSCKDKEDGSLVSNQVRSMSGHEKEALSLARISAELFVTGSSDGSMHIRNQLNGKTVDKIEEHESTGFYSLCALGENRLATGSCHRPKGHAGAWDHTVRIWDLEKKRPVQTLRGHEGGIATLVKSGDALVSASGDHTVRVWDTARGQETARFGGHTDYVYGAAALENGEIVTGSKDREAHVFDPKSGEKVASLKDGDHAHESTIYDVDFLGNQVVTASRDGMVKVWDRRKLAKVVTLNPDDGFVFAVRFAEDGSILAGTSGKQIEGEKKKKNANMAFWPAQ